LKGKTAYGCSEYKKTCDFLVPMEFNGIVLSASNLQQFIHEKSLLLEHDGKQVQLKLNSEGIISLN
jgi:hypothetical protein